MKEKKKNEVGAIMIEILAVLALIGVMGPMLFRQVVSRNQEISNVNMASEMRSIKEATSAYIAADGSKIGMLCLTDHGASGSNPKRCSMISETAAKNEVYPFLPVGLDSDAGSGGILDYYTINFYAYWVDYGAGSSSDLRPFVYAVISSNGDGQPQAWNFRRAARVASLIGADGGVVDNSKFIGTNGGWELPVLGASGVSNNSVVATTAFDTFEPDLGILSPNAVYAPDDLAFGRLHAWNYFSVGEKGPEAASAGKRCFEQVRRMDGADKALPDTIKNVGIDGCDPLFWVGAVGATGDTSEVGHVYAKKNVYVGRDNTNNRSAIALETNKTALAGGNDKVVNQERRIVVYDIAGKDRVTIDATGKIVAKGYAADGKTAVPEDDLTIQDGKISVNKTASVPVDGSTTTMKNVNYGMDVANTSVLNDVRLSSRGGARLSDILPNYIAKDMYLLSNGQSNKNIMTNSTTNAGSCSSGTYSSSNSYSSCTVSKPICPGGYKKAIMLQPMKWKTGLEDINIPLKSIYNYDTTDGQFWLTAPAGGGSVTGGVQIKAQSTKTTNPITVKQKREVLFTIQDIQSSTSAGNFTVQMGYPYTTGDTATYSTGELQAIAQTYCVYDTVSRPNSAPKETTDRLDVVTP